MHIRFDKIDGFIRVHDSKFRNLLVFHNKLFDKISDNIKCLVSEKSGITDNINHNFGKLRMYLYNLLPIKKT